MKIKKEDKFYKTMEVFKNIPGFVDCKNTFSKISHELTQNMRPTADEVQHLKKKNTGETKEEKKTRVDDKNFVKNVKSIF